VQYERSSVFDIFSTSQIHTLLLKTRRSEDHRSPNIDNAAEAWTNKHTNRQRQANLPGTLERQTARWAHCQPPHRSEPQPNQRLTVRFRAISPPYLNEPHPHPEPPTTTWESGHYQLRDWRPPPDNGHRLRHTSRRTTFQPSEVPGARRTKANYPTPIIDPVSPVLHITDYLWHNKRCDTDNSSALFSFTRRTAVLFTVPYQPVQFTTNSE